MVWDLFGGNYFSPERSTLGMWSKLEFGSWTGDQKTENGEESGHDSENLSCFLDPQGYLLLLICYVWLSHFPIRFLRAPYTSNKNRMCMCTWGRFYFVLCNQRALTYVLRTRASGLPWWRSGWESAWQCRGHGFEPRSGKIPHAAEQLGPWATITEPARLEPVLRNKRGHDSERPAHSDEEWPPLATTRESPRTETNTQHSHK